MTFLLILVIAGYIMLNYLNSPSTKLKSNEYEIVSSLPEIENNSWQQSITSEEYYILVEKGTERPFSGELLENKKSGTYLTAGCNLPVFSSETKFDSGTGWPSFTSPISNNNIILKKDYSLGIERVEVLSSCGEHLGHVFPDGPEPDGLRFCINSKALKFIEN
ncbi:peptide-methionine (R)-S-oxide reductase [Candidatus Pacearchaeota archaeon CG10_big_fil_rev_8_21_14_0_10_31_24]|nr:MAG: peptide-methionine (R)-S-oxide reductase [Candidatus Pacearchaeota archaeon CG10_big_fil_rev_8_21_14_0_10_31_24]